MKREISSSATTFYKVFGPAVALAIFVGYMLSYLAGDSAQGLAWAVLFCALLALATTWGSRKLMRVSVDDKFLYVSNYREEVRIPLSNVADVEAVGSRYKTIIVTLATPSRFGHKIMFVPRDRGARDSRTGLHPTVVELKDAVAALE